MAEDIGPVGFWSYAHKDNDQVGDRITRLASRIKDEYSLLTGDDLELFLDRESIMWGDKWKERIDTALQETTFFIPVITPRYFNSQECRKELLKFAGHVRSLDAVELLLPILYVNVADLNEDSDDEAKALIASTQYSDWRDLRLTDESSENYGRAVNELATRLAGIAESYGSRPSVTPKEAAIATVSGDDDSDEPGLIDLIAEFEENSPKWLETITAIPAQMEIISAATDEATAKMQKGEAEGKGFGYRVVVARELAAALEAPSSETNRLGQVYASQVVDLDPGMRALITLASNPDLEAEDREAAVELFEAIVGMVQMSRDAAQHVQSFYDVLAGTAKQSRDLRPAVAKIRQGLRGVLDAQGILDEWEQLIAELPPEEVS